MEKTNLKESNAVVKIEGVLSEKNLEVTVVDGEELVKGNMVIQTDEHNFVTVDTYMKKLKNDGTENKAYNGILTVIRDYRSIAEVGKDEATKVKVTANVRPNTYYDRNGNLQTSIKYSANFYNRVDETKQKYKPKAEFEIELFITAIVPETITTGENAGDETGRVIVKGYMPTYNGIEPIELVAPSEYGIAEAITETFQPGDTAEFDGDVINSVNTKTVEIPMAIGKPKEKTTTTYRNELVISGASDAYEEEKAYDPTVIRAALTEREVKLEALKNKASNTSSTAASTRKAPKW